MGTRSLTFIYEEKNTLNPLLTIYRQYDGYPTGHGRELANILCENVINANGMGCLAATIVARLKESPYNIYIVPSHTEEAGQDFEYHVYPDKVTIIDFKYDGRKTIFNGSYPQLLEYCMVEHYEEQE